MYPNFAVQALTKSQFLRACVFYDFTLSTTIHSKYYVSLICKVYIFGHHTVSFRTLDHVGTIAHALMFMCLFFSYDHQKHV